MTSRINPNSINVTFPLAQQNNNSQGFRDNFKNIQTNFQYAKTEITELQTLTTSLKSNVDYFLSNWPLDENLLHDRANIANLQIQMATISSNVAVLNIWKDSISQTVSQIYTIEAGINSNVSNLQMYVADLSSNISNVRSTINTLKSNITTLETSIVSTNANIAQLRLMINGNDSNIGNLRASLGPIASNISNLTIMVNQVASNATQIQQTITLETIPFTMANWRHWTGGNVTTVKSAIDQLALRIAVGNRPVYSLRANRSAAAEGDTIRFTCNSSFSIGSENVPYSITGVSSSDIIGGSLTGNIVLVGDRSFATGYVDIQLSSDATTEGSEVLTLSLTNRPSSNVTVTINDTSTTSAPAAPSPGAGCVIEGTTLAGVEGPIQSGVAYVTGRLVGGTVWGDNNYGYTTDSDFGKAAVHAGLITNGQRALIRFATLGNLPGPFPGTTQNGVTTSAYSASWCTTKLSLA